MNLKALECRVEPVKMSHYIIEEPGNNTVKAKKKKDYEYYLCDRCGEKIILYKKWQEKTGGVIKVPISSLKILQLALCTKCVKPTLKEVNATYKTNF